MSFAIEITVATRILVYKTAIRAVSCCQGLKKGRYRKLLHSHCLPQRERKQFFSQNKMIDNTCVNFHQIRQPFLSMTVHDLRVRAQPKNRSFSKELINAAILRFVRIHSKASGSTSLLPKQPSRQSDAYNRR